MSNKYLAKRIKEEREKRGWTQEYMAGLLNIKIGTLSGYERSYRTPDVAMLEKIADLFETTVDDLLGRTATPWYERDEPPTTVELEKVILESSDISLFGDPVSENAKHDVLLALRTAWEVLKKERERAAQKQPKGK